MDKIKKYFEYAVTAIEQKIHQKKFIHGNVELKYMLDRHIASDKLIVIFSACTRMGVPARYNYVRTLKSVKMNKLFILDDFGPDRRGGYYLGEYPNFLMETATKLLIDQIAEQIEAKQMIFVGSSKGGYAALNFGMQYKNSIIIAGAPQYWLGKYLLAPANSVTLQGISTQHEKAKVVAVLNGHLKQRLEEKRYISTQKIYLHYSEKEHTYQDHIEDLLSVLYEKKYHLIFDVHNYKEHNEVSLFYPKFILETLKKHENIDSWK